MATGAAQPHLAPHARSRRREAPGRRSRTLLPRLLGAQAGNAPQRAACQLPRATCTPLDVRAPRMGFSQRSLRAPGTAQARPAPGAAPAIFLVTAGASAAPAAVG